MPRAKQSKASDPDTLIRQAAGTYRTADDRFEVRGGGDAWFLVDTAQTNEFGQELILGPFDTLKAVRVAIPGARDAKVTPLRRPKAARPSGRPAPKGRTSTAAPPPPPPAPTWIDRLGVDEARRARAMIRALEGRGVTDAEELVRRDREGLFPVVAATLVRQRLEEIVAAAPEGARAQVGALVEEVARVLSAEGMPARAPLPGWTLVEVGPEPEPPNRRIDLER